MLQYLHTLVSREAARPGDLHPDRRPGPAEARQRQVLRDQHQRAVRWSTTTARTSRRSPGATVAKIPVPDRARPARSRPASRLENGVMISRKARERQELRRHDAVRRLAVVFRRRPETFAKWGVEGTTYTGTASATARSTGAGRQRASGSTRTARSTSRRTYGFYNGVFAYGGSTKELDSSSLPRNSVPEGDERPQDRCPLPPPAPLSSTTSREQATLWETALKDYVNQQTLKFVLGQRPLGEWDAYVSELKAAQQRAVHSPGQQGVPGLREEPHRLSRRGDRFGPLTRRAVPAGRPALLPDEHSPSFPTHLHSSKGDTRCRTRSPSPSRPPAV